MSTLQSLVENLNTSNGDFEARIIALETGLSGLEENLRLINENVTALTTAVTTLDERVGTLDDFVRRGFESVNTQFAALDTRLASLEADFDQRFTNLETDVAALASRLDGVDVRIDGIDQQIIDGLASVNARIDELRSDVTAGFEGVEARFETLEQQLGDLDERFVDLAEDVEDAIDGFNTRIIALENRVDSIETRIGTLSDAVDAVQISVSNILTCSEQFSFYAPNAANQTFQGCVLPIPSPYPDFVLAEVDADTFRRSRVVERSFDLSDIQNGTPTHLLVRSGCISLGSDANARARIFINYDDGRVFEYDLCLISGVVNNESNGTRVSHFIPLTESVTSFRVRSSYEGSPSSSQTSNRAFAQVDIVGREN